MGILNRATRNIIRKKRRTALVLAVLSISLALMITLPASIDANQQASKWMFDYRTSVLQEYSARLNVVATEIDFKLAFIPNFGSESDLVEGVQQYPLMNLTDCDKLGLIPNVEKVIPIFRQTQWAPGEKYGEEDAVFLYDLYGIPLEADLLNRYPSILPTNITAGRNLEAGDRGVVVLDEIIAGNLSVGVGDTVDVLGQNFTVVGIKGEGTLGLDYSRATGIFMSIEEAQRITNNSGKVSYLQIFANSADNVESIVSTIKSLYPPNSLQITTAAEARRNFQQVVDVNSADVDGIQNTMSQIQSNAMVGMVLAVVIQGAIILFIMMYSVRERTKEIGTLKAMGASNTNILCQFMLEGTLLSLIAGIIGITISIVGASTLGSLMLPHFNLPEIDMIMTPDNRLVYRPVAVGISPQLMLIGLSVAVLLGIVGSMYPAWRAARTHPAEAMKYE